MATVGSAGVTTDDQTNAAARRAAGEFVRGVSKARSMVTDLGPGADADENPFDLESGRYHLYVALNCPWCHRVAMTRAVLGLEEAVSMDILFPGRSGDEDKVRGPNLWRFLPDGTTGMNGRHTKLPECTADTASGLNAKYAIEIYEQSGITDEKSVPIFYDKKTKRVVNNESAEIMRMFETVFLRLSSSPGRVPQLWPASNPELCAKIDEINTLIYTDINNGAYKAGFSSSQDVYEAAYHKYFAAIETLDRTLEGNADASGEGGFLCTKKEDGPTESDIRAFVTLWRHDKVYYTRMKLDQAFLSEYPFVWGWMKRMLAVPGMDRIAHQGILQHSRQGYFGRTGNGTIPLGPRLRENIIPPAPSTL